MISAFGASEAMSISSATETVRFPAARLRKALCAGHGLQTLRRQVTLQEGARPVDGAGLQLRRILAGLPQAKLSRKSNQVARGRIRRFESYMPSQAVRSSNASHVNVAQNGAEERAAAAPNAM